MFLGDHISADGIDVVFVHHDPSGAASIPGRIGIIREGLVNGMYNDFCAVVLVNLGRLGAQPYQCLHTPHLPVVIARPAIYPSRGKRGNGVRIGCEPGRHLEPMMPAGANA